jgi:hypothetical protein
MKNKIIKIVKVPLEDYEKSSSDRPQVFPRMPRLYLELLENKVKIKQDLINKDYVPSTIQNVKTLPPSPTKDDKYDDKDKYDKYDDKNKYDDKDKYDKYDDKNKYDDKDKYDKYDDKDKYDKYDDKDKYDKYDDKDKYDKYDDKNKYDDKYDKDKYDDKYDKSKYDNDKYLDEYDKSKYDNDKYLDEYVKSSSKDDDKKVSPSSNISDRLQELLKEETTNDRSIHEDKYSRHKNLNYRSVEQYKRSVDHDSNLPPTLSELEKQGGVIRKKELRDINSITHEEQYDEDAKREIMFKMDLLRKSYPGSQIPEYSIHSDYNSMKRTYESTVRRLSLDSAVENYKTYLIGGFMVCEFVFGSYLGFDMAGFTQQQILSMNSYEVLLIELGEKSYLPGGSKWPVEIRLLFMILCNAGLFIVSKMIMKQTGSNLLGLINNMNRSSNGNTTSNQNNASKRKMKEPNINFNDLPEIPSQS